MDELLPIEIGNLVDMRAKLPRAREILDHKEERLRQMERETESWRALVDMLERMTGLPADREEPAPSQQQPAPLAPGSGTTTVVHGDQVDLVVAVVNREARPIRAREVAEILRREGHDVAKTGIANSLYYAAVRAKPPRICKQKRGTYAPLGYEAPAPLAYSAAAHHGFAPTDHLPANGDRDRVG